MYNYELAGLKNVEELHHIRTPHKALKYFRLTSDYINLFWVQSLLAYDFESTCFNLAFSHFLGILVLNYDHNSITASAKQATKLEELAKLDLL